MRFADSAHPTAEDINPYLLPPLIRQIAEHVNLAAALKIMGEYGGVHLCVPQRPAPEHRLVELLGPIDAAQFCQAFGGDKALQIPKGQTLIHHVRKRRMVEMRAAGATLAEIARYFGLTERRVTFLLGRREESSPQLGFDFS